MLDMDCEMASGSKSPSTAWSDDEEDEDEVVVIVVVRDDDAVDAEKNAALFILFVMVNDL